MIFLFLQKTCDKRDAKIWQKKFDWNITKVTRYYYFHMCCQSVEEKNIFMVNESITETRKEKDWTPFRRLIFCSEDSKKKFDKTKPLNWPILLTSKDENEKNRSRNCLAPFEKLHLFSQLSIHLMNWDAKRIETALQRKDALAMIKHKNICMYENRKTKKNMKNVSKRRRNEKSFFSKLVALKFLSLNQS